MGAIILSHSADPDGVVSAALIGGFLNAQGKTYDLRFADHPDLAAKVEDLARMNGNEIWVADLTFNGPKIPDDHIIWMGENNEVRYFDHHPHAPEGRLELIKRKFMHLSYPPDQSNGPSQRCTALLLLDHLGLKTSERHKHLALVGQSMDYRATTPPEIEKLGMELNRAIRPESGLSLSSIVEAIIHNEWQQDNHLIGALAQGAARVEEQTNEAYQLLEATMTYHTVRGLRTACAFTRGILYMKEGLQGLKDRAKDADLFFIFYGGLKGFIADHNGSHGDEAKVPLLPFLRSKGGGGRQNSGGFSFSDEAVQHTYEARRDYVLREFESFSRA